MLARVSGHLACAACLAVTQGCSLTGVDMPRGADSVLQVFQGPTPGEAAEMAQNQHDASARYQGVVLLANAWFVSENPAYIRMFEDYLANDADPGIRAVCARALGNHGGAEHSSLLARALDDETAMVRIEAARALQRIHNPVAIDPLIAHLFPPDELRGLEGEPNPDVRVEAARALGQYRDYSVMQALIGALEDPDLAVNRAAQWSLETLTGQNFAFDTPAWLAWLDETDDPFAAGNVYIYPVYRRDRSLIEMVPFIPPPPNETAGPPAGLERGLDAVGGEAALEEARGEEPPAG